MVATLGYGISAAIVEELAFRGGLLAFLLRITGNRTLYAWVWIIVTAFLWALLHYLNTDNPGLKLAQIFILGVAFGFMARRWGPHISHERRRDPCGQLPHKKAPLEREAWCLGVLVPWWLKTTSRRPNVGAFPR